MPDIISSHLLPANFFFRRLLVQFFYIHASQEEQAEYSQRLLDVINQPGISVRDMYQQVETPHHLQDAYGRSGLILYNIKSVIVFYP